MLENNKVKLQFNPFIKKEGQKYKIIAVTDIQYHSNTKRPTNFIGKLAEKNQGSSTPYRAFTEMKDWNVTREKQKEMIVELLQNDQSYIDFIKDQEEKGYKILLEIPDPIPLRLGADTEEFLNSKKGKRIIRWLAKEKS